MPTFILLRSKPRLTYCGLTIVLSNPSRFDTYRLLSGPGGHVLDDHCLRPDYNVMQCDIRLAEDKSEWLAGTKCILLLGEGALHTLVPEARNNTLNEVRGSVYDINGIPAIASFYPQDAADMRAHESALNPLSKDYTGEDGNEDNEDAAEDYDTVKKHGKTKRANYAFWLRSDTRKCIRLLKGESRERQEPSYKTYVPSDEVIKFLAETKNQFLYFDIETDYEEQNLQCFSFSFDGATIYNVPVLDFNYRPAYSNLAGIIRALAIAVRDNTLVAHNGAAFDFFVLGYKYRIPVNKVYDTMIAHHRCFPDIERSLGHCTSYWTWERFHKDEDSHGYMTRDQMNARMKYCGKDVFTMFLIHQAITKYAKTIVGLEHSIDTAMSHIVPFIVTSLQGIRFNIEKLDKVQKDNDKLMMQYMRVINLLIGSESLREIQGGGKLKGFANSNAQCIHYFHDALGYPVVARSKKTGKPSLSKKAMFKLALKHNNPVIRLVLAYRTVAKEYGTLKFTPFRDDSNKIIDTKEYERNKISQS